MSDNKALPLDDEDGPPIYEPVDEPAEPYHNKSIQTQDSQAIVPFRQHSFEKSLPHSRDAERAVLGAIVLDSALIAQVIALLKLEDFYIPSHRRIFFAMITLFELGEDDPGNPILIGEELKKSNALETSGGVTYITNLAWGLPHSSNIQNYAKVLRGKSLLRQLITVSHKTINECIEEAEEPQVIHGHAMNSVFGLSLSNIEVPYHKAGALAYQSLQKAHLIKELGNAVTGVDTGFADINEKTLGLQPSDLIIVAGRPGSGKTAFSLMLAQHAAFHCNKNVVFFSLEMSKEMIAMRILCSEANIDTRKFQSGYLTQDEFETLHQVQAGLLASKLWIIDTPGINVAEMKAKCMRIEADHGKLDLMVADYIGLMGGSGKKKFNVRQEEVSGISRDLKGLAKELNIPLVADCQLNRGPEQRADHRPQIADLRESGSLEQDADVVMLLYRADMYRPKTEPKDKIAEVDIAKQRNGPTGSINLRFEEPSTRFDNLYLAH